MYTSQVSIEFGLSEMLNSIAIKPEIAPKDGKFDFMISELEAIFPDGMVDHSVDPVYKEVRFWNFVVSRLVLFCFCLSSNLRSNLSLNLILLLALFRCHNGKRLWKAAQIDFLV